MGRRTILLTGADGLLGGALRPHLDPLGTVHAPDLQTFDLARPETIASTVASTRPDLIVHLAAETRVDYCEEHPDEAYRVNAAGTAHLAVAARRAGARLVYLSTDYVFDGAQRFPYRETVPASPINAYGRSKADGERAVRDTVEDHLIVRSSSLYGEGGRHFVAAILEAVRRGEILRVVDDQIQSPSFVGHLAPHLARVACGELGGILHLAGTGACSWHEFAQTILDVAGIDAVCEAISTRESGRPAPRPAYSVLDCTLAEEAAGIRLPHWSEGLSAYLKGSRG